MRFYIQTDACKKTVSDMDSVKNRMNDLSGDVKTVLSAIRASDFRFPQSVLLALEKAGDKVLDEAVKMDSLSKAFQHIINHYLNSERTLAGSGLAGIFADQSADGFAAKKSDAKPSWFSLLWKRLLELLKEWTQEQALKREKEHDLYLQSTIFAMLEAERFSKETWAKASVEERKEILKEFMHELRDVFGVNVADDIVFFDGGTIFNGGYSHNEPNRENYVSINYTLLEKSDSYKIMQTMIHEMRHAYQHAAVDHPDQYPVSSLTISKWRENFKSENYKTMDKGYTYEEYVSQPIEWDAKNFAKQYTDIENASPEYAGSWEVGDRY